MFCHPQPPEVVTEGPRAPQSQCENPQPRAVVLKLWPTSESPRRFVKAQIVGLSARSF